MPQILIIGLCLLVLTILSPLILLAAIFVWIDDWRFRRIPNNWHFHSEGGVSYQRRRVVDSSGGSHWETKPLTAAERDGWNYWGARSGSI